MKKKLTEDGVTSNGYAGGQLMISKLFNPEMALNGAFLLLFDFALKK